MLIKANKHSVNGCHDMIAIVIESVVLLNDIYCIKHFVTNTKVNDEK